MVLILFSFNDLMKEIKKKRGDQTVTPYHQTYVNSLLFRFSHVGFDVKVKKQYEHERVLYDTDEADVFWPWAFKEKYRVQEVNDQNTKLYLQNSCKIKRIH